MSPVFLRMVNLGCSSVAFLLQVYKFTSYLLVTVHVDTLPADAQSRFAVAALLFVAVSNDIFSSSDVRVLILTWSLCFIFYDAHTCSLITEIVNKKACSTSLLGG